MSQKSMCTPRCWMRRQRASGIHSRLPAISLAGCDVSAAAVRRPANVVQSGDLYILDLFPACAFYFGDTCRTFAVGEPTPEQRRAWKLVADTLAMAEKMLRPGLAAKELYTAVRERLAPHEFGSSFWHHAGHGVGFHGHEAPRLIPGSDDVIEVGDVIAIEPALYSEQLRGGIRLENTLPSAIPALNGCSIIRSSFELRALPASVDAGTSWSVEFICSRV